MLIAKIVSAAIIAVTYSIIFNVPKTNIFITGLNGALGYFVYLLFTYFGFESYVGMFFASMVMSAFADIFARIRKVPTSLFLVAALIPIVPGGGMFQSMLDLLKKQSPQAGAVAVKTLLETGAIAFGVILVSPLLKLIPHPKE